MKIAALPLLLRARDRIAAGWCRGMARDAAGVEVFPDDARAVAYGIDGAIFADPSASSYVKEDALRFLLGAIRHESIVDLSHGLLGDDFERWDRLGLVAEWNDTPSTRTHDGTTQADALRLYDRAIALADRFGEALAPVRLLRRAPRARAATERAS